MGQKLRRYTSWTTCLTENSRTRLILVPTLLKNHPKQGERKPFNTTPQTTPRVNDEGTQDERTPGKEKQKENSSFEKPADHTQLKKGTPRTNILCMTRRCNINRVSPLETHTTLNLFTIGFRNPMVKRCNWIFL
jgi:hypothetical protein